MKKNMATCTLGKYEQLNSSRKSQTKFIFVPDKNSSFEEKKKQFWSLSQSILAENFKLLFVIHKNITNVPFDHDKAVFLCCL